jgi:phosphoglycerate dehydrogenase-like enzyme
MAVPKVVFFNALSDEFRPLILDKAPAGINLITASIGMEEVKKIELAQDADFIMVFPGKLSDGVMRAAKKCRLIQVLSAAYDEINLKVARELGIPVANNGGANSVAVAEHTMMAILAAHRRLVPYANHVKAGGWRAGQNRKVDVFEFEGKMLGLLGIGNIAQKVARRARAFDARIQYFDKYAKLSSEQQKALEAMPVSFEELLRTSDVISVHVPLTKETTHLIGKRELSMMKPNAIIINTARGGIIDEKALLDALQSGTIAGAALDVREQEPPDPNDPLSKLDNVIATPHIAGPTLESFPKRAVNGFANIMRVWNGEPPLWTAQFE